MQVFAAQHAIDVTHSHLDALGARAADGRDRSVFAGDGTGFSWGHRVCLLVAPNAQGFAVTVPIQVQRGACKAANACACSSGVAAARTRPSDATPNASPFQSVMMPPAACTRHATDR